MNVRVMPRWLPKELLGKKIRQARTERLRYSQARLAEELGIPGSQSEISKWEHGKEQPPYEQLLKLADLAGLTLSFFEEINTEAPSRLAEVREPRARYFPNHPLHDVGAALTDSLAVRRFVLSVAGRSPAETRRLRIEVLGGIGATLAATHGQRPQWWYELVQEVEDGTL